MKMLKLKRAFGPEPGRLRHWLKPKPGNMRREDRKMNRTVGCRAPSGPKQVSVSLVCFFFFCFRCFDDGSGQGGHLWRRQGRRCLGDAKSD
ncbi:hypothetical protein GQ607_016551 [Colletotrichum asianum]|uniref:Uncharacterized protein n=1 Tax=Colletotrichum asianum TaxID=702518 RepID=A0A8H3VYS6_9PEZI|nr:hypothetical protein GQ607_016551 [Colletotrichum asianum]